LRSYFADQFDIEDLRGLDLFHNRFAPDSRWNSASLAVDDRFCNVLARLEETYAKRSEFMERATHLLLIARRRQAVAKAESKRTSANVASLFPARARIAGQKLAPLKDRPGRMYW
jgi:hypothetical protein